MTGRRLTDADRAVIQRARDLADAFTSDDLHAFLAASEQGPANPLAVHVSNGDSIRAATLGIAQHLLAELAMIVDRLDSAPVTGPAPGPFETEAQVRELPAVRAVHAAFDRDPGVGKMAPHSHRMLCEALSAAGVELGAYDHRIVSWLAGWEPQTVAVIAGWVQRAARHEGVS
jgi:hypothetical protein